MFKLKHSNTIQPKDTVIGSFNAEEGGEGNTKLFVFYNETIISTRTESYTYSKSSENSSLSLRQDALGSTHGRWAAPWHRIRRAPTASTLNPPHSWLCINICSLVLETFSSCHVLFEPNIQLCSLMGHTPSLRICVLKEMSSDRDYRETKGSPFSPFSMKQGKLCSSIRRPCR